MSRKEGICTFLKVFISNGVTGNSKVKVKVTKVKFGSDFGWNLAGNTGVQLWLLTLSSRTCAACSGRNTRRRRSAPCSIAFPLMSRTAMLRAVASRLSSAS